MNSDPTLSPPVWVDTTQGLNEMAGDLALYDRLAVDTESNSLHAYREQVCLIQFSTSEKDYLLDPLVLHDLSSLGPIFSNRQIEKIFHAAEYDLICLRRDFGFTAARLFDTMQAARILGYEAVGLDRLLGDKFNIEVDKRHQKADWGARPLTTAQIHYARFDTHYLFDLRDALEAELRTAGRWQLAQEDFERLANMDEPRTKSESYAIRRFAGRKDITNRELTVLNELCLWRESEAEKLNRPLYKILSDDTLISLAREVPSHHVDLAGIGLSQKQIRTWGEEILKAVDLGMNAPLIERKTVIRPDEAVLGRLEKLKIWRKKAARELKVESDIVLPRAYLFTLAEKRPKDLKELNKVMADSNWRVEHYGDQILKVLGG